MLSMELHQMALPPLPKQTSSLWKRTASLWPAPKQKKQKTPGQKFLEKDNELGRPMSLEKFSAKVSKQGKQGERKVVLTPAPGVGSKDLEKPKDLEKSSASANKPLVVVDWHNTLEVGDDVSGRNAYALTLLCQRARVVILSYVASKKKEDDALSQMKSLPHWKMGNLMDCRVCWPKCGVDGKTRIAIFAEVQKEYREQGLDNRLTNLKLSMFTDASKPWASTASLHVKAGEAKHLLPALVPVLEKIFAGTMKEEEQKMIHAASSLEKLVKLWDTAGDFLTPGEFTLGKEFLLAYKWLNSWSLEKDRNSIAIVAKHHTFLHLLSLETQKNNGVSGVRIMWDTSLRCATKLSPKYRLLVHFMLTRSLQVDSFDPGGD